MIASLRERRERIELQVYLFRFFSQDSRRSGQQGQRVPVGGGAIRQGAGLPVLRGHPRHRQARHHGCPLSLLRQASHKCGSNGKSIAWETGESGFTLRQWQRFYLVQPRLISQLHKPTSHLKGKGQY